MKNQKGLAGQRVMAVRLVMEGYLGKDVAAMLNLCRQTVVFYVSLFNLLLDRKSPLGRVPFLMKKQQQELKQTILIRIPAELGWDPASS